MIELTGQYTDGKVMGLNESEIEEDAYEQIQTMINHEAFQNPVRVMPDTHWGKGCVIGFTMPLGNRVIPNVIGVDIGCGMYAAKLGDTIPEDSEEIDTKVRNCVPMGFGPDGLNAPERDYYHVKDDFPWDEVNKILDKFINEIDEEYALEMKEFREDGGYDISYFKELVNQRASRKSRYFDMQTAIGSVGTLGAGNHFVEIGRSVETDEYWVVVHSGSRGLGANTAQYWQEHATHLRRVEKSRTTLQELPTEYVEQFIKFNPKEVTDKEMLDWLQGAKGESFINYEALKSEYKDNNAQKIETIGNQLKEAIPDESNSDDGDPLAYLEGQEAAGYLIDMIFCQKYASESRKVMASSVASSLNTTITDEIEAVHNFIDFRDQIIRKGATRAYEGERAIVPFNMQAGTLIVEGKSNENWNNSVCHGAGRVMSRTQAKEEFTEDEIQEQMDNAGAYASELPLDEAPGAYKDPELIENAIKETATIIDRLEVVHNFKAA